jgi:hypothetical protein
MNKKSFKRVLMLPLALWVFYELVAFVMGYTAMVNTSVELLLGDIPVFFAVIFGIWIGRRSYKVLGDYIKVAMINGLILSLVVGFVAIILTLLLANTSSAFAQTYGSIGSAAATSSYTQSISLTSILESAVSSWVKVILVTIVGAAMGFEFSSKK